MADTPNYDAFREVGPIDEAGKIRVMRDIYGADAERILSSYGTMAYDFLYETLRDGSGSNPYGFTYANRTILRKEAIDHIKSSEPKYWAPYIIWSSKNRSFDDADYMPRVNESAKRYKEFRQKELEEEQKRAEGLAEERRQADARIAEMQAQRDEMRNNMTSEDKIATIKMVFGDKAETILISYGTLAYDMYEKMYMEFPQAPEGDRALFEKGLLSLPKAAKYAGFGENDTAAQIVALSANAYKTSKFNYPFYSATSNQTENTPMRTKEFMRSDAQQAGKEGKITQWLSQVNLPADMKDTLIQKYGVDMAYSLVQKSMLAPKDAMETMGEGFKSSKNAISYFAELDVAENSAKLTELTGLTIETPNPQEPKETSTNGETTESGENEVVVTAPALSIIPPVVDTANLEIDFTKVKIKSSAEIKYDELLAKKNKKKGKDQPDDVNGRRAPEVGVTLRDIEALGIDVTNDLQTVLKRMDKEKANSLIPEGGFSDKNVVISKELAIAMINYGLYVKPAMMKRGKER